MPNKEATQEIVQALEQIVDGGCLDIDRVWSKDPESEKDSHVYLRSSVLEGPIEIETYDPDGTMCRWLEAMDAIAENNGFYPKPMALSVISNAMEDHDKLTTLMDDNASIEKVAMRLTMEVGDECFSGLNIVLTFIIYQRDKDDVLVGIHLLDLFAYDTAES